jgi:hypothetical protein
MMSHTMPYQIQCRCYTANHSLTASEYQKYLDCNTLLQQVMSLLSDKRNADLVAKKRFMSLHASRSSHADHHDLFQLSITCSVLLHHTSISNHNDNDSVECKSEQTNHSTNTMKFVQNLSYLRCFQPSNVSLSCSVVVAAFKKHLDCINDFHCW